MKEEKVKDAIRIILSDEVHYSTTLNYAINYCKYALGMEDMKLRTQCLYILNNIIYWRHPMAKKVREALKEFVSDGRK